MDFLNKPKPFTPEKNQVAKDWQIWKQEFLNFLKLSGAYDQYSEEDRALLLLNLMGTEAFKAIDQMHFDDENEKKDMDIMMMKFDEIFDPPLNEVEERYKFFSRRKSGKETIDNFVMDLKEKATKCNFGSEYEKQIVDAVIRNMDDHLRGIIFPLEDLTLSDLVQYYKQHVLSNEKIMELTKDMAQKMNYENSESANCRSKSYVKQTQSKNTCYCCGTHHSKGSCPAYGKICSVCNTKNHFGVVCKKRSANFTKNEDEPKRICSKCGTNHPYMQCPAHEITCLFCFTKGHYASLCKQKDTFKEASKKSEIVDEPHKKSYDSTNKNYINGKSSGDKIENCLWCERKHAQGQCPHSLICTRCDVFPHNICFQCRKNPHDGNCYYKSIITLPSKVQTNAASTTNATNPTRLTNATNATNATRLTNATNATNATRLTNATSTTNATNATNVSRLTNATSVQHCLQCGRSHGSSECPAERYFCHHCNKSGHLPQYCYLLLNNKQNANTRNTSATPEVEGFVKVENRQPHSNQYRAQTPGQTYSSHYKYTTQQRKNNFSKSNQKSDSCCIS